MNQYLKNDFNGYSRRLFIGTPAAEQEQQQEHEQKHKDMPKGLSNGLSQGKTNISFFPWNIFASYKSLLEK